MKQALEQFFGCKVEIKENGKKLSLPVYLAMRPISVVEMNGVRFAVVDITNEPDVSITAMKKQRDKYEEALGCPIAYEVSAGSISARNGMVKNGIAFIDLPGNVYLPFLGIVLLDVYRRKSVRTDRMMPATQMVFLELFYMKDDEYISKSKVAERLNLTKTSLTRATAQLKEMGLIEEKKNGTEIAIKRNLEKHEYFEKAEAYLISPVQQVVTVLKKDMGTPRLMAGETALNRLSELNPPRIEEAALYKGSEKAGQLVPVDARFENPDNCLKLQLWKYNPFLFAEHDTVDPISLICSFRGNEDERIDSCLEEILKGV